MKKIIFTILMVSSVLFTQGITNTLGGNTLSDKFKIDNQAGSNILTVTGNGKVGVGILEPHAKLHVISTTTSGADNTAKFAAQNIGNNVSHIHYGTNGDWYIRSAASTGNVIIQDSGGNVGIGTSFPESKLDVEGTVKVGVNGVIISEIIEITGTTTNSGPHTNIAFPSGYTMDNTRILSIQIKYANDRWFTIGTADGSLGTIIHGILDSDDITIVHRDNNNFYNKQFRMILMKII
jgi:hypothetical protein